MDAHMKELYGAARAAHVLFAESAGQLRLEQDVQKAATANGGSRPRPPAPATPAVGLAARLAPGEHMPFGYGTNDSRWLHARYLSQHMERLQVKKLQQYA